MCSAIGYNIWPRFFFFFFFRAPCLAAMAHYTSIDHSQQAEFPDTSVAIPHDLAELLYFRYVRE